MAEKVEIRGLKTKDVHVIARMLGKVTKGARQELVSAMTAKKGKKVMPMELGMTLFQCLAVDAEEDLKAWMASLINKEVAEYEEMPATTVIDIIEQVIALEDFGDFFSRASQLSIKLPS